LRQLWRDTQAKLAHTRDLLTDMERQARETEPASPLLPTPNRASASPVEAYEKLAEVETALQEHSGIVP
jgi:hypothetical protein